MRRSPHPRREPTTLAAAALATVAPSAASALATIAFVLAAAITTAIALPPLAPRRASSAAIGILAASAAAAASAFARASCVDRRPLRRDSIRPIQTATALFGSSGALVWGLFCVKIICIKSKSVLLDERGGWCHKVDGDGDADADTLTVTVMVNSSSKIQLIRP